MDYQQQKHFLLNNYTNTIALAIAETSLDLQEDLLSIEEEKDQPAGENVESMPSQLVPVAIKPFDDAAEEKAIDS